MASLVDFLDLFCSLPARSSSLADPKPPDDPGSVAASIAGRFQLELSPGWADWFDREIWRDEGVGEFRFAATPNQILEESRELIWPGLMPPDFLPLIGNGHGDWLCGRVNETNQINQVVHWYHGGGDWLPWGNTLAEAILFDAVTPLLPGPHRRHAMEAEDVRPAQTLHPNDNGWLSWALHQVDAAPRQIITDALHQHRLGDPVDGHRLAGVMLEHDIAQIAVRCELVQWESLQSQSNEPTEKHWTMIESHCRAVIDRTVELAWPWEWLGLAKYHQGETYQALIAWRIGSSCSAFTDQSVRMRPADHIDVDVSDHAKFSVAMMCHKQRHMGDSNSYLDCWEPSESSTVKSLVYDHWCDQADTFRDAGDHAGAVRMLMQAGWDLGVESMPMYGGLLKQIAVDAAAAGQRGRSKLATLHATLLSS